MKKDEIIAKLQSEQGDTDYVFRTQAEDKTFLENHARKVIDEELPKKVSEVHQKYDDDLFDLFGKRKKSDQKTYNFLKEEFGSLKSKAQKVEKLESEIEELRKGNPTDAKRLAEIQELQNSITQLKATHERELNEFAQKMQKTIITADIKAARSGLKIKKDIPESLLDIYFNQVVEDLAKNAEYREGKTVFLDPEKKTPLRNQSTMLPYTAQELLAERMKDYIDTGHKQDGVKLPKDTQIVTKDKDGKSVVNISLPADVTSREKLGAFLKQYGLKSATQEYRDAYKELGANLPVTD